MTKASTNHVQADETSSIRSPHWRIWEAAEQLEKRSTTFFPHITPQVVPILQHWGNNWAGDLEWRSILDKGALLHEIEESIVALHHYWKGVVEKDPDEHIVVDVCGGKGLFSFLLSYLKLSPKILNIVLIEKANINWHHIKAANDTAEKEGRPLISIWSDTNLHDHDKVLGRLQNLNRPVAMSGIHLCKQPPRRDSRELLLC